MKTNDREGSAHWNSDLDLRLYVRQRRFRGHLHRVGSDVSHAIQWDHRRRRRNSMSCHFNAYSRSPLLPQRNSGGVKLSASRDVFSADNLVWHAQPGAASPPPC